MPGGWSELAEESDHLFVSNLSEVLVESPDRPKRLRDEQADHVVAPATDLRQSIQGGDGHGDDDLARVLSLDGLDSSDHGRAGGNAIIGDDHRAAGDRRLRPDIAKQVFPARDHAELKPALFGQVLLYSLKEFPGVMIQVDLPILGNSPNRQFRLPWRAQLAGQDHVEVCCQLLGQYGPGDHAAARDGQYQRVVQLTPLQFLRQLAGCIRAITKHGCLPPAQY